MSCQDNCGTRPVRDEEAASGDFNAGPVINIVGAFKGGDKRLVVVTVLAGILSVGIYDIDDIARGPGACGEIVKG